MKEQESSIQELQAELGTGLMSQLTAAEQQDLADLNPRIKQLEVTPLCQTRCLLIVHADQLPQLPSTLLRRPPHVTLCGHHLKSTWRCCREYVYLPRAHGTLTGHMCEEGWYKAEEQYDVTFTLHVTQVMMSFSAWVWGCVSIQDSEQELQEALLQAQATHTEASTKLTEDLLLRRQRLQADLAAADLPSLE